MKKKESTSSQVFSPPQESSNLSDRMYRALKNDILRCILAPGDIVAESELARQYSVSRTPVREALARLIQDGFVRMNSSGRYVVTPITVRDVQEVYGLRAVLEPEAARLAAPRISEEVLDELDALLHDLLPVERADGDESARLTYLEANSLFHMSIAKATGNGRMVGVIARLMEESSRYVFFESGIVGTRGIEESLRVLEALHDKDAPAAQQHMQEHIQNTYRRTLEAMLSNDGLDLFLAP